jgi:hypothetical protein
MDNARISRPMRKFAIRRPKKRFKDWTKDGGTHKE